ncbi:hypothetical protein AVEN_135616-1 [Araneus ventricosus]|uniref:Uncharacterized protein n=1 Tax=Araneus ventricosus TaxID=182803 RepID=A0A4Y2DU63_ARAVE|nr:hypothetical protein AVEN_135616-1 [Araneus ventricosus]
MRKPVPHARVFGLFQSHTGIMRVFVTNDALNSVFRTGLLTTCPFVLKDFYSGWGLKRKGEGLEVPSAETLQGSGTARNKMSYSLELRKGGPWYLVTRKA